MEIEEDKDQREKDNSEEDSKKDQILNDQKDNRDDDDRSKHFNLLNRKNKFIYLLLVFKSTCIIKDIVYHIEVKQYTHLSLYHILLLSYITKQVVIKLILSDIHDLFNTFRLAPTPEDEEDMKDSESPEDTVSITSDSLKKDNVNSYPEIRYVDGLRSVLLLQKRKGPKKVLKWKTDLESIRYFELDETERVNVTKTFTDMKQMEKQNEREAFQMARKLST